ncbi:MAG TPA: DUF3472 domain-containing protein [Pedobacter sp.]|nr:DUF3472 domain-containing protein [Pedobacter sp.]
MTLKKTTLLLIALQLMFNLTAQTQEKAPEPAAIMIPVGGNGWLASNAKAEIKTSGLQNWTDKNDVVTIYFRTEAAGSVALSLRLKVPEGTSRISMTALGTTLVAESSSKQMADVKFGNITVKQAGYIKVELRGISKSGNVFAEISDLLASGAALTAGAAYVKNNEGNYFYWGHRGPSVHLNYDIPKTAVNSIEWFYNEITVPKGEDKIGTYYMANGFSGGYFGMQVNSTNERRVLFSIWSPFETDDPKSIPDSMKIVLLKKGSKTRTGEFGNEGSGGQSFMVYPWEAGKTYAFLTRAQPNAAKKTTIYTSYFKDTQSADWILVASFERPQSAVYLKGLYSFLENFAPNTGDLSRRGDYKNQWAVDSDGKWYEITKAKFTADATARINYRKDYAGGTDGTSFYLKNCGFFSDFVSIGTLFERKSAGKPHPLIDFTKLP